MKVQVLAVGCARCRLLEVITDTALEELGWEERMERITDVEVAKAQGVKAMPVLLLDDKVVLWGRVPMVEEVKTLLLAARKAEKA
ncbi:MAG: MTH895/ArsE family thioredoxin-like protein [Methanomassiliicoccales archaeon]